MVFPTLHDEPCMFCEGTVHETMETYAFEYGVDEPVQLWVTAPVMTCEMCGEAWCDYRAEEIHAAAVKAYLTPE